MKKIYRLDTIFIIALTLGFGFTLSVVNAGPPIAVISAVPNEAKQGTDPLAVTINGRGFDNSMVIEFCLSEFNEKCEDGGVDVIGSVRFINSKQLEVTVTVDGKAIIGNFDIEATSLSSGRRGRGTEKFRVLDKDGDVAMYSVMIFGDVEGGSDTGQHWRGDFGGKNDIGLNDAVKGTLVGEFTNLSFFSALFEGQGNNCFPSDVSTPFDLDPALTIHQGRVSKRKRGIAQAGFFFDGWTHTTVGGEKVKVLATLKLIGTFVSGETWPPPSGSPSTLEMTDWEMSVTNEGQAIKSISCIDKGDFEGGAGVTIMVTKIDPET